MQSCKKGNGLIALWPTLLEQISNFKQFSMSNFSKRFFVNVLCFLSDIHQVNDDTWREIQLDNEVRQISILN